MLSRAELFEAQQAMHWLTGSVGQADASELRVLFATVPVLLVVWPCCCERQLRVLELGDDTARGLGARTELSRAGLLVTAVALIALAVSVAGPIAFVALVAGPIANRLLGPAARRDRWPRPWSARPCCSPPTSSPPSCCPPHCPPAW